MSPEPQIETVTPPPPAPRTSVLRPETMNLLRSLRDPAFLLTDRTLVEATIRAAIQGLDDEEMSGMSFHEQRAAKRTHRSNMLLTLQILDDFLDFYERHPIQDESRPGWFRRIAAVFGLAEIEAHA